jgi:hypothetical protein
MAIRRAGAESVSGDEEVAVSLAVMFVVVFLALGPFRAKKKVPAVRDFSVYQRMLTSAQTNEPLMENP